MPRGSRSDSATITRTRDGQPTSAEALSRWDERRQEVVDTAAHLFAKRGYHATTIADLVDATGLQRGGLYHYISSKSELLIRIHERFINPLLEDARRILAAGDAPDVALRDLAHALMHDIVDYQDQVTVFLHEWQIIENDPEWKGIRAARKEFEGVVEQVLRAGAQQGMFQVNDVRLTVLAFLGIMNYTTQWYRRGRSNSADELADYFVDIFLRGIQSPDTRPTAAR